MRYVFNAGNKTLKDAEDHGKRKECKTKKIKFEHQTVQFFDTLFLVEILSLTLKQLFQC